MRCRTCRGETQGPDAQARARGNDRAPMQTATCRRQHSTSRALRSRHDERPKLSAAAAWSSGMILGLGPRGPGAALWTQQLSLPFAYATPVRRPLGKGLGFQGRVLDARSIQWQCNRAHAGSRTRVTNMWLCSSSADGAFLASVRRVARQDSVTEWLR